MYKTFYIKYSYFLYSLVSAGLSLQHLGQTVLKIETEIIKEISKITIGISWDCYQKKNFKTYYGMIHHPKLVTDYLLYDFKLL